MRRILVVVFGILLAATLVPPDSRADIDYDSGSLPNLGLGPAATSKSSVSTSTTVPNLGLVAPAPSSAPAQNPASAPASTPAPTSEPTTNAARNADSSETASTPSFVNKVSQFISRLPESSLSLLPGYPTIVHETDMSSTTTNPSKYPKSLTIYFGNRSSLGSADAKEIGNKLGLSPDQISSACYLSASGALMTDLKTFPISLGLSPAPKVYYDGSATAFPLRADALCLAGVNLPRNGGTIIQINDRYVVPLQGINCPLPKANISNLVVTYVGTESTQCAYQ